MPMYEVPFISQYADLGHHEWRARGCGIASLKMIMDFYDAAHAPSLDELLQAGIASGAYQETIGWTHRGLVQLAERYGYDSYNVDVASKSPTPKTPDEAWDMLRGELERGPVMASVWRYLDPEPHGGHMVVITGWDGQLVSYNEPIELSEREGREMLALATFQELFKQRYIVIRPKASVVS